MILETLVVGALSTNCYLVGCQRTREAMVIDPGDEEERIATTLERLGLKACRIMLTHFHFDHILAAETLRAETGAPIAIHHEGAKYLLDPPALFRMFASSIPENLAADEMLHDGDHLSLGDVEIEVLATPGHSPDGISLSVAEEGIVFCGDTLFREGIGRTDFPGSSHATLMRSIAQRLFTLPDETILYPGHGPQTTVGHERRHNPWVAARPK